MFNLEQAIADWRNQMLAAGIKSPVPLEELETHLREEIEQQMKSGLNEQEAFNHVVEKIGQPSLLKTEFKKIGWFVDRMGENKSARTKQILSVLWFALCTRFLIEILSSPVVGAMILYFPHYWSDFAICVTLLGSAGVCGSILLFYGAKLGQYVVRSLAIYGFLLSVFECATVDTSFAGMIPRYGFGVLAMFNLVTIWLLDPPQQPKLTTRCRIIRIVLLGLIAVVAQYFALRAVSSLAIGFIIFNLVTIWLFGPPQKTTLAAK